MYQKKQSNQHQNAAWVLFSIWCCLCLILSYNRSHSASKRQAQTLLQRESGHANLPSYRDVCGPGVLGIPSDWQPGGRVLALTFDDGPLGETTLDGMVGLLDVLRAEQVPATFFVNTYANTFDHPKVQGVLKRMLSEGHDLGSHTAEHLSLTNLTAEQVEEQLQWAISNISMITNSSTVPLFRSPYGDGFETDDSLDHPPPKVQQLWDTVRKHHLHIGWSLDGKDWEANATNPHICRDLYKAYGPRLFADKERTGIVLMHTFTGMGKCPHALQQLIRYFKRKRCSFVKVSTLVEQLYGMGPAEVLRKAQECGKPEVVQETP